MVEYGLMHPEHYDGISEYACAEPCGYRIGRWCGQELKDSECENRFCDGTKPHKPCVLEL